jgi:hypothetical protein
VNAPANDGVAVSRLAALLLAACTAIALANLPGDDLPPGWLLAFVLPGAVLAWLSRFTPRPWQRASLAVVLQTAACLLALDFVGAMSRPAALACTILPPLGFATARRQEADQALALFLSFCVLLVGVILDGIAVPLIAAYGVCACLALRCANHLAALAASRRSRRHVPAPALRAALGGALPLVAASLFTALAIERTIDWLPTPSRSAADAASASGGSSGPRRVGLDDAFQLDGARGLLTGLTGEQLVRAVPTDGSTLPPDLYLRSGFFAVPGVDRWQLGALDLSPPSRDDGHVFRLPLPGLPTRQLELDRYSGGRNFVFVPPGTARVHGVPGLTVDGAREWIRQQQRRPADTGPYHADYQELAALPVTGVPFDPRAHDFGLLALPRALDRARYEELLERWRVPADVAGATARIAAGLAELCRYDRAEPQGPWPSALDNFLFAPTDRRGYCMHFASAAALLLRLRGVPCRIGVGLFGGDVDRADAKARIFGSQHAHAWVEIPFEGRGYVVFDPTPAAERGQRMPSRLDPAPLGEPDAPAAAAGAMTWDDVLELLLQPWLLASLLVLALAASVWQRDRAPAAAPPPPVARSARRLLARLLQALTAAGHPRRGRTLEAFARALAREQRLEPAVADAFLAYQQVRFGGRAFDGEHERRLRVGIEAAAAMVPPEPTVAAPQGTAGSRQST